MARFEMHNSENATMGGETRADVFRDMGLMYATGRGCPIDLVSAHKWLNIAAIKGCDRAAHGEAVADWRWRWRTFARCSWRR